MRAQRKTGVCTLHPCVVQVAVWGTSGPLLWCSLILMQCSPEGSSKNSKIQAPQISENKEQADTLTMLNYSQLTRQEMCSGKRAT